MKQTKEQLIWVLLRLSLGWLFLWAFLDKLIGLGFSTTADKAWIVGSSPTAGFLEFATKGPFADFYASLAGNPIVDWLFMLGLLIVGVTFLFGYFVRIGSYVGIFLLTLMYTAGSIFPEHNPFMDEHLIYILVMAGIAIRYSKNSKLN